MIALLCASCVPVSCDSVSTNPPTRPTDHSQPPNHNHHHCHPQVQTMLLEVVAPHHDPEQVLLPQGVLGCSWAAAAFVAGAGCALGAALPAMSAVGRVLWQRFGAAGGGAAAAAAGVE